MKKKLSPQICWAHPYSSLLKVLIDILPSYNLNILECGGEATLRSMELLKETFSGQQQLQ
jgi:hypothetical protein